MAADIDCPLVVVHVDGAGDEALNSVRGTTAGTAAGITAGTREEFIDRAEALERAAAALTVLCQHAADLGVAVLIENQPDGPSRRIGARVSELLQLVDMIGVPNIGLCFDVAHAVVSTGNWEDELRLALPHLQSVHASDTDGVNDSHLPLGEGGIDWERVLAALEDVQFEGGLVLEVAGGESALERSLDELRPGEGD